MKRLQQGFTLIELMIVVAIVGILAAIALPAYQDYVIRSKMSEAVAAIAACKTSVSEYMATKNAYPSNTDTAGCSTLHDTICRELDGRRLTKRYQRHHPENGSLPGDCVLTLTANGLRRRSPLGQAVTQTLAEAKYVPSNFR